MRIESSLGDYSGYYCYDEQHIELNGRRWYWLSLFESLLNIPVAEEIAENSAYETIYGYTLLSGEYRTTKLGRFDQHPLS